MREPLRFLEPFIYKSDFESTRTWTNKNYSNSLNWIRTVSEIKSPIFFKTTALAVDSQKIEGTGNRSWQSRVQKPKDKLLKKKQIHNLTANRLKK